MTLQSTRAFHVTIRQEHRTEVDARAGERGAAGEAERDRHPADVARSDGGRTEDQDANPNAQRRVGHPADDHAGAG